MKSRQRLRSEETKQAILSAAGKLFAVRGYSNVTMREIANEAGCSHTTIYIYFTDKATLLLELSTPPLQELIDQFDIISKQHNHSSWSILKEMSMAFIRFGLENRSMYYLFFITKGMNIEGEQELEINKLRLNLFAQMQEQLKEILQLQPYDDRLMLYSRMYFYMLHGIISTYIQSEENYEALMNRLAFTFEEAIDALFLGLAMKKGEN